MNKFVCARNKMHICNAHRIFIADHFTHRNYQIWIIPISYSEQCNSFASRFCVENCSFPHLHTNLFAFLLSVSPLGKRILYIYLKLQSILHLLPRDKSLIFPKRARMQYVAYLLRTNAEPSPILFVCSIFPFFFCSVRFWWIFPP